MTEPQHWTETTWNGVVAYRCAYCPHTPAGEGALLDIKRHVGAHLLIQAAGEVTPALHYEPGEREEASAVLDFASKPALKAFVAVPEADREAVALYLLDRTPDGVTGYTVGEVREAVAAVTTEEE